MKGLIGAATVMGTLMYGAGHVWAGRANFYLHDHEIHHSPPDEAFIDMLTQNCRLAGPRFPPPAIVEVLQDYITNYHKVRRLHLIVVDLWRPWKYHTSRAKEITDQLWFVANSEFPCYLVWPQREEQSYVLLEIATSDTLLLDERSSLRPLGMQHFYDSFALVSQISLRSDALVLFGLRDDELWPDLHITRAGVLRTGLGEHHEPHVDHNAQAADRNKVPAEVIAVDPHEVASDSGDDESSIATSDSGESSSESDTVDDDPSSSPFATDLEQYELMQTAYLEDHPI